MLQISRDHFDFRTTMLKLNRTHNSYVTLNTVDDFNTTTIIIKLYIAYSF